MLSRLSVVFESIEGRLKVENEDVAPTRDAPATSEWATI